MKKLLALLFLCMSYYCQAQSVGIGTTTPNPSAALDVSSNNKGFLPPRMSSTQRNAIANPRKGLMVYDTTQSEHVYFDGGKWRSFYEKNYDSAVVDYISSASASVNMSNIGLNVVTGNAGFIYDSGGPTGNYFANSNSEHAIVFDDSTVSINLNLEEMNLETFYDSLYIISFYEYGSNYDTIARLSGTQVGNFSLQNSALIVFKSNSINNLSGYKIRWGKVKKVNQLIATAPLYGWFIDNRKSAAMGGLQRANNWHTDSVGLASLNYGMYSKAKGKYSVALGFVNNALGAYSFAIGNNTNATGTTSTAMGNNTNATGTVSTAMGKNTTSTGVYSTAMGSYTVASGGNSIAMGQNNIAQGDNSTAMGRRSDAVGFVSTATGEGTAALGDYSTSIGYETIAKGISSFATGSSTNANSINSTTMGRNTIAKGYASTVIGTYNDSLLATNQTSATPTTPLFIVGNGDGNTTRSNAMVVYKSGNVDINGNLKIDNGTSVWSSIPIGFAANRTTTLSVPPSTFTDVLFNTQGADDGGDNYDPVTGEFTVPTAGMYRFEASVYWNAGIAGFENIYFYVNGVTRRFHSIVSTNTSSHTLPFTASFKLNAGDIVKVVAYHTNATAVGISANGNGTYFTGVKVY